MWGCVSDARQSVYSIVWVCVYVRCVRLGVCVYAYVDASAHVCVCLRVYVHVPLCMCL